MKKNLLAFFSLFLLFTSARAEFGIWASAVYLNVNGSSQFYCTQILAGNNNAIGSVNFNGNSLGSFVANTATLSILGGEVKTFRDNGGNVCSGKIFYTVYPQGARPASPVFSAINLGFFCECSGGTFNACGGGTCTDGRDQKWQTVNQSNDLTQLATGDYTLELYYQINGDPNTNTCTVGQDRFDSNLGNNYTANFTITTNLPVNFSGLSATAIDNQVKLKWSIENDVDVVRYEIERSANGIDFTKLNTVNSVHSILSYNYSLIDKTPLAGVSYYRVKFYKNDNSFSYSKICKIDFSKMVNSLTVISSQSGSVSIHFNSVPKGKYYLTIINTLGQRLVNYSLTHNGVANLVPINMQSKLSKGVYRLILSNGQQDFRSSFIIN